MLNQVVLSVTSLCEEVIGNMESEVVEALKDISLPEADQKTVTTRLASVSRDPFEGLTTEFKQEKYYKENFNYLVNVHSNITQATHHIYLLQHTCECMCIMQEPTGRIIGTRMVQKGGLLKEEKDLCYDILFLESLQNFMNMHVVRDQVCTYV